MSKKNPDAERTLSDDPALSDDALLQPQADKVYAELLERVGESAPRPRLEPTRRAVELLGDPQRAYPVIHLAGTNGKTSTSRITESLLRAHGLRTGLLTSPHLLRVNERIMIDGEPISNEAFIAAWEDIRPFIEMVDAELEAAGEAALTFFEAFTVLAFASFADAPVDVAVIETGMGGEWDSTNVADGAVTVHTPISLDHTHRLGSTLAAIAETKAGIIKTDSLAVTAVQTPEVMTALDAKAGELGVELRKQGTEFDVIASAVAVGGQLLSIRGLVGRYDDVFLPLYGTHQAQNAALAVAAVELFLGGAVQALAPDIVAEAFATVTSPGRLELVGIEPTVLVDAAHNPDGAASLVAAVGEFFTFEEVAVVVGVLEDKDAEGIIRALAPLATRFYVTESQSERTLAADDLAYVVRNAVNDDVVWEYDTVALATQAARGWAAEKSGRAVVVTGSITLVAEALQIASVEGWKP